MYETQHAGQPIGIFDSGIGGLTVAHAIKKILPGENLVYFGDTAHLPYGDKSEAAIQAYSVKISNVLLEKKCKVIVIACHSASSAAYHLLKEYTGSKCKVINVIDPMVDLVTEKYPNKVVGLIGTKRTIESNIYKKNIDARKLGIDLRSLSTPLFVPMIEEGYFNNMISHQIIGEYLSRDEIKDIDSLILGCTHYPLIKNEIGSFYLNGVEILDSADVAAASLHSYLKKNNLLNTSGGDEDHFLVSDFTKSFESAAKMFFHHKIKLEKYTLWE